MLHDCPFCGSSVKMNSFKIDYCMVGCPKCGFRSPVMFEKFCEASWTLLCSTLLAELDIVNVENPCAQMLSWN
jgi:hypothetical protein